jgi:branched-chain amino acid transport system ATP-binding protein
VKLTAGAAREASSPSEPPRTLVVSGLSVTFGGVRALRDVSLTASVGEVCGLIGPNGAGKSTLFKCITRRTRPTAGSIRLGQIDLLRQPVHRIASLGVMQTFQEVGLFPTMTTLENVMIGGYHRFGHGVAEATLAAPRAWKVERRLRDKAEALLDEQGLAHLSRVTARDLPYGNQKMVEVIRALMGQPSFLLLDEPGAGLTAEQRGGLGELIRSLGDRDLGVILVEHNMGLVMESCDRIVALDSGSVIAEGTPAEIRDNPQLQESYLGKGTRD